MLVIVVRAGSELIQVVVSLDHLKLSAGEVVLDDTSWILAAVSIRDRAIFIVTNTPVENLAVVVLIGTIPIDADGGARRQPLPPRLHGGVSGQIGVLVVAGSHHLLHLGGLIGQQLCNLVRAQAALHAIGRFLQHELHHLFPGVHVKAGV